MLGCTELVMAVDVRANVLPVYDTTEIHARACVEWMLAGEEADRSRRGLTLGADPHRRSEHRD